MFSIKKLLGKEEKFYDLLEASAEEAKVSVGGKPKCNATITFRHIPFPNPDLRGHMDAVAKRIGFPEQVLLHD